MIVLIFISILIIATIVLSILICKVHIIMNKIHNIISFNSIELEKIKEEVIGEENTFGIAKKQIEGIHTVITTQLVKGLLKDISEE